MADNYEVMARVMKVFSRLPRGKSINREELPTVLSLARNVTESAIEALQRRGWASVDPRSIMLIGLGQDHVNRNAAQLLALDIAECIRAGGKKQVSVDELPQELRADLDLLALAL